MKTVRVHLESVAPYSQSKQVFEPKNKMEQAADYEERTWRHRIHRNEDGYVVIPGHVFKICLQNAAQFLSMRVPGKGQATYSKHFKSGVLVLDDLVLPIKAEDVQGERLSLNADGKSGGGKRVVRIMPVIPKWSGVVTFYVGDETINQEAFEHHMTAAGQFIGIGRWRPQSGGMKGRFRVNKIEWDVKE